MQSAPCSTADSMASAASPVGVRLADTSRTAGATPAPVRASVTWAVAGLGAAAARRFSASVTVCFTAAVAGSAAAVVGDGPAAPGPAVAVPPATGRAVPVPPAPGSVAVAVPGSVAAGPVTAGDPLVQAASKRVVRRPAAMDAEALRMAVARCRESAGRLVTGVACRSSVARFMPPFCHAAKPAMEPQGCRRTAGAPPAAVLSGDCHLPVQTAESASSPVSASTGM
jgi:hypothetical protein